MQPATDSSPRTPWGSFWALVVIQSMNSLNEKGVQFLLIGLGIWMARALQYPLSVLIIVPFVLFSPLGGWLADRYCKTRLLQAMVALQVVALLLMTAGLWGHSLWLSVGGFCIFSVQAMFFSPAKKGLVKDMVGTRNIGFASGILEISSMLALLVGQIGALCAIYALLRRWGPAAGWEAAALPCTLATGAAVLVLLLGFGIPRYAPQGQKPFDISLLWQHLTQLRLLWDKPVLRNSEVGIGYFWFIAGTMMLIVLQMAAEVNPVADTGDFMNILGQQRDSALLFGWLSGGAILGGLTASLICARGIRLWVARAGGVGMTLACAALALIPYGQPLFFVALFASGFAASGYLVPLNARLQDEADDDKRGDVIAAGNLVDCVLGIASVVLQGALMSLGVSPQWQCALLALSSALVALFIWRSTR
ncbi:MAG: MFS transporter [Akkermansia sp.]